MTSSRPPGGRRLDVFDETEQRFTALSLFPDDRELPADAVDSVQVRLSGLELKRPRIFGNCWLACELWQHARNLKSRKLIPLLAVMTAAAPLLPA